MSACPPFLLRWWRHLCFVCPWGHDVITERRRIREDARATYQQPRQGQTQ